MYTPPARASIVKPMGIVLELRPIEVQQQSRLDLIEDQIFVAGDTALLERHPIISIVGTRECSEAGAARARRLARELAEGDTVIMSGLACGIDTHALMSAVEHGGRVIGVIPVPLDRVTPKKNADLQEVIYRNHLLVSPFPLGTKTKRHHFPQRNQVMALLSDATVIVEAGETSGTIHQAAECMRLGRDLFFMRSLVEQGHKWVRSFLETYERAHVLESTTQLLRVLEQ